MTGLILLAAGASTRLGRPKQLLPYKGKTLLQQAIDTALATPVSPVIVVLGQGADTIREQLHTRGIITCINPDWQEGMAAAIRQGIRLLQQDFPQVKKALLMVCDQPYVSAGLLREMITTQTVSDKKIVACRYRETVGVPVLFHRDFFPELLQLQGNEGARKLLSRFEKEVLTIPFAGGETDIDTEGDYQLLLQAETDRC